MAQRTIMDRFNNLKPIENQILKIIYSEPTGISKAQLIENIRKTSIENWSKDSIVAAASNLEVYGLININKRRNFHSYIINYKKVEQIKQIFGADPEEMKTALEKGKRER